MRVKEDSEKAGLKVYIQKEKSTFKQTDHGIQSHHFMVNRRGNNENSDRFSFLGTPKNTVDGDCSHEIKRCLLGRKAVTNPDSVLKSRDISLSTKSVQLKLWYGYEHWTMKKAEH